MMGLNSGATLLSVFGGVPIVRLVDSPVFWGGQMEARRTPVIEASLREFHTVNDHEFSGWSACGTTCYEKPESLSVVVYKRTQIDCHLEDERAHFISDYWEVSEGLMVEMGRLQHNLYCRAAEWFNLNRSDLRQAVRTYPAHI